MPGSHELATPGPVSLPLNGPGYLHLRWKSQRSSGYWEPPTLKLPFAGTYWVSAATKSQVRTIPAATFNQMLVQDGMTIVAQYRKQYKQTNEPGRVVTADYAKTMITVGPPEPITPIELNLPIEFILRYPQLVQLNFRGQPIADIQVNLNGKPIGRTNGAGQLPLPLLNSATKLTATVARAYPDPTTAPWEFFNASLTLPPLSQRQAAIDHRELPGDELRGRQVVDHGIGNLIARTEALGGRLGAEGLQGSSVGLFKGNGTGSHAVDADLGGPGAGHGARHVDDAGFGGAVVHVFRPGFDATDRGDVYDPAAFGLLQHGAGGLLGAEEVGFEVGGMDEVPVGFGDQKRIDPGEARGVVYQGIQGTYRRKEGLDLADLG
jgi:hypothetical protein